MLKEILQDFCGFAKRPTDVQYDWSIVKKTVTILILFCIELCFTFAVLAPLHDHISELYIISQSRIQYPSHIAANLFAAAVIMGPLLEEILFRLVLRYQGFTEMIFSRAKWDRLFPYLVYGISVVFGLAHLKHYSNDFTLLLMLSPLIIGSQIVGGVTLAYVRVRFSLIWSIVLHMLWNGSLFCLFAYLHAYGDPYTETTRDYTVEIKEVEFYDPSRSQELTIDTLDGMLHALSTRQLSFQHTLDSLYGADQYRVNDLLIDIDLVSEKGIHMDSLIPILSKEHKVFLQDKNL